MNGETIAMIKALQVKSIEELKTSGGISDAGKVLTVGGDGRIAPTNLPVGEGEIALDGSLSVSGAAADAKVVGDAISAVNDSLDTQTAVVFRNPDNTFPFTFEDGTYRSTTVGQALEKFTGNGYDKKRKVISTTYTNVTITTIVTAKEGYQFNVFLSESGIIKSKAEQQTEYTLDSGKQYGITLRPVDSSTDISAVSVDDIIEVEYKSKPDITLTQEGAPADAKAVGDKITEITENTNTIEGSISRIDGVVFGTEEFTLSGQYSYWINANNIWESAGSTSAIMSIREGAIAVDVTANDSASTYIAFLTTTAHVSGATPDFVEGTSRIVIPSGTSKRIDIPDGAKYIYVAKTYKNVSTHIPDRLAWVIAQIQKGIYPLGLHEMPPTKTALNIVKRCRQMTDIKWTPAVDLQRFMLVARDMSSAPDTAVGSNYNYLGTFRAGVEYKGIPYGRVANTMDDYGYTYGTVGNYIGFDTFISAVGNPHSKISKERIGSVSSHTSIIYATVCSGFVCYALDVPEVPTASIPNIQNLSLIGKINDNGELLEDSKIKIGYIINLSNYHTAVITDIIRDDEGVIQFVELSDASTAGLADKTYADGQIGGLCRRKGWTREQFFKSGSWGDYSVYKYGGVVNYTPSPYVKVGDEFDMYPIEHFPIMPYEGENFKYKSGYIPNSAVKLVLNLTNYSHVRAFKDGEEVTGSPFAITSETESVDIDTIDTGTYYAYLCNISDGETVSVSYPCHWTIE